MSRYYTMAVTITGAAPDCVDAVKQAAEAEWTFDDWLLNDSVLTSPADGSLCGGETEEEFAERLAKAIWFANDGYCRVEVRATYLDQMPFETHCLDENDYRRLVASSGKEAGDAVEPQSTRCGPYDLAIDGPTFRSQRELLLKLQRLADGRTSEVPDPHDRELLEGLIELTDALADQAHDKHGVDCLLDTEP